MRYARHYISARGLQVAFAEWIKKTGEDKIAKRMGVSINTVYSWSHRNQIPRSVWPELLIAFCENSYSDLIAMEKGDDA